MPGKFQNFTNRLLDPGNVTDNAIVQNREMADMLLNRSTQGQPIRHPLQGAALMMNALNSQIYRQRANRGEEALKKQRAKELGDFISNMGLDPGQAAALQSMPEEDRRDVMSSVAASRFSSGDPFTLSPGQSRFDAQGNVIARGGPSAESPRYDEFDVLLPDGKRVPVEGRIGQNSAEVLLPNGQFVPMGQAFPNAVGVEPSVRRQAQGGPNAFGGGFETASNRDEERTRLRRVMDMTGELAESIGNVRQYPRSAGSIGAAADVANRLGDIPGVGHAVEGVTQSVTGLSPEQLATIRTQGEAMVAKLVPVITGDESGRYTDTEQKRTRDIQAQSKFWRTSDQVIGGLSELQSIEIRGEIRKTGMNGLSMLAGQPVDLSTDEGINRWGEVLVNRYQLSPEMAVEEIRKHRNILGLSQ